MKDNNKNFIENSCSTFQRGNGNVLFYKHTVNDGVISLQRYNEKNGSLGTIYLSEFLEDSFEERVLTSIDKINQLSINLNTKQVQRFFLYFWRKYEPLFESMTKGRLETKNSYSLLSYTFESIGYNPKLQHTTNDIFLRKEHKDYTLRKHTFYISQEDNTDKDLCKLTRTLMYNPFVLDFDHLNPEYEQLYKKHPHPEYKEFLQEFLSTYYVYLKQHNFLSKRKLFLGQLLLLKRS